MTSKNLPLVIMSHTLPDDWIAPLRGRCELKIGPVDATRLDASLEEYIPEADGLFVLLTIPITESLLKQGSKLRVISNMAVGVDNIDLAACTRRGIPVGNTPGVLTESTADLTMALMLSAARNLPKASLDARDGRWKTWSPAGWLGADLSGAMLGIIGMGKIGRAVAKRARGFNMRIVYSDPNKVADEDADHLALGDLLSQSDFVSLHIPLTLQTRHLIDAAALRRMKPSAILINAARGPIVDTDALYQALNLGWISQAALDVTDPEPLPPDHPLYTLPNCLIVPHIGSATHNTRRRMAELACENLLAGLAGKRMPHCVNPEVYTTSA